MSGTVRSTRTFASCQRGYSYRDAGSAVKVSTCGSIRHTPLHRPQRALPPVHVNGPVNGNSTFVATKISSFEVTSVSTAGGGAISTGSAQVFVACGAAVRFDCGQSRLHSWFTAFHASGKGRPELPSTAGMRLGGDLNSNSPSWDGASRRGGCCHITLVSGIHTPQPLSPWSSH